MAPCLIIEAYSQLIRREFTAETSSAATYSPLLDGVHDHEIILDYHWKPDEDKTPFRLAVISASITPTLLEEARIGLFFQRFVLTRALPLYERFITHNDQKQARLYSDLTAAPVNFIFRDKMLQLCNAITRVGFLSFETAHVPGAVEAWIESVNACTAFVFPDIEWEGLHFFCFTPNLGRYIGPVPSSPIDLDSD